jgi:lysozyme
VSEPCLNPSEKSSWSRFAFKRAAAAAVLAAAVTVTSAGIANAAVIGPDVSVYQHGGGASLNWGSIHQWGQASFAFIKATEGGGYLNPDFASDYASATSANLIRGAYHFARPTGSSPAAIILNASQESNQFTQAIGSLAGPGNLPPVLDLEDAGNLNPAQLSLWTHTWLDQTAKATGRTPIIYTNPSFWRGSMANATDFAAYPLWVADYGATPPAIGGWAGYTFWQYTSTGSIPGATGTLDLSLFNGSFAQLQAMTMTPLLEQEAANQAWAARNKANQQWAAINKANQQWAAINTANQKWAAANAARQKALTTATLNYTTQASFGMSRAGQPTSRSTVRSWLSVVGMGEGSALKGL